MGSSGGIVTTPGCTLINSVGPFGTATAASSFGSIPQTYTHLEVRIYGRSSVVAVGEAIYLRCNADTTTSYYSQSMHVTGPNTPAGAELLAQNYGEIGTVEGASGAGGFMSSTVIWIPGYRVTTAYKSMQSVTHVRWNVATGNSQALVKGVLWAKTAAINEVLVGPLTGSWEAGSVISLYGYL